MPLEITGDTDPNKESALLYRSMLRSVFSVVCDKQDWKSPIDANIPANLAPIAREAIIFMTGSVPKVEELGNHVIHITADGYYIAMGEPA